MVGSEIILYNGHLKRITMIQDRNIYKLFFVLAIFGVLGSCSEERPIESKITYFPTFEVSGDEYLLVQSGVAFNDPGVVAKSGDSELPIAKAGTVNTDQPGVYKLTYSATNGDGFDASTERYVIVADDPDFIINSDISGKYTRDTNPAHTMTISKITDGVYQADDILPTNGIKAIIIQYSSTELVIPLQSSGFGDIIADTANDAETSATLIDGTDITLKTRIGSFGVFTRNFIKN